ncbi:MAG: class I SAM-dependent methyltransferase [Actinobacteria bacterium]|nr:class I SAM-dependent methyltransferase [Actinomycetota bacterium]
MNKVARIFMNSRAHARSRIKLIDSLLEDAALYQGGTALEIGCGAGFSSAHIARQYRISVVGTDAEADRVETARRKNSEVDRLSFLVADATALPFEDAAFDLVLSQNVFHHIPDWQAAAEEVARVIRPRGMFLFSDISGPGTLMRLFSRLEKDHGFHEADVLISLLNGRGLKVIRRLEPEGSFQKEFAILFLKDEHH